MYYVFLVRRYLYLLFLFISMISINKANCLEVEKSLLSISSINNKENIETSINSKKTNIQSSEIINYQTKVLAQEIPNIQNQEPNVETENRENKEANVGTILANEKQTSELLQLKLWDVLSTFIVTLPAIISASAGLIGVLQIRRFNANSEEDGGSISISRVLLAFLVFFILLGIITSIILSRWQRSNNALSTLTQQQVDQIVSASLKEFTNNQNSQLSELIEENISPTNSNIQSIKNRIQNIETKLDNSENITSSSNTPTVNINQIISETFSLIRWAILISIGAIFGLRILGFLFRSADNWLNSSLQEGVMKRQREREEEMRKAERQREIT